MSAGPQVAPAGLRPLDLTAGGHDWQLVGVDLMPRCRRCMIYGNPMSGWMEVGHAPWPPEWCCKGAFAGAAAVAQSCECGARAAMGIGRGAPGHSPWCPWAAAGAGPRAMGEAGP